MSVKGGPNTVTSGLVLELDAGNIKSYQSGSTTWFDKSGFANNGTLTNGPTFNSANGGSMVFDGTDDLVLRTANFAELPTTQLSAFLWIKFSSLGAVYELLSQGRTPTNYEGEWILTATNVGGIPKFSFWDYNSGYGFDNPRANTTLVTNQWYYLGFVKNNTSGTFYLQGIQDGTTTGISKTYTNTGYVLGGGYRDSAQYLSGNIAIAQIYNRALTADEVLQNYNATKTRFGL
jgi:hypothetical protein